MGIGSLDYQAIIYASSAESAAKFTNLGFSFTKRSHTIRDPTGSGVFFCCYVHIDWIYAPGNSIRVVALHWSPDLETESDLSLAKVKHEDSVNL